MKTAVGLPVVPLCLLLSVWAVNYTPTEGAGKVKVRVFTDVDIQCRLPENAIIEDISSLQIAKSKKDLSDFEIIATAVATKSFPSNQSFPFPGAEVSGSVDEEHLNVQIPNITRNARGIYKCTVNTHDQLTTPQFTERLITLAKESTGTLHSYPPGFQIKISKRVSVTCNQGCMCNQTFLVNSAVYSPADSADQPHWHCVTTDQGDQKCWMSAACEDQDKTQFELQCTGFTTFSATDTGECTVSFHQPEENVCPVDPNTTDTQTTVLLWTILAVVLALLAMSLYAKFNPSDKTKDNKEDGFVTQHQNQDDEIRNTDNDDISLNGFEGNLRVRVQ